MTKSYKRTTISCFFGISVQAVVSNLTAILFIPMMELYGFSYAQLGILIGVNFATQVGADVIFSGLIDKIGYRGIVLPATLTAFAGLLIFALSPEIFPGHVYVGIIVATIIFAFASGIMEVVLSPIVAAIPGNDKGPAMSLMHSFYAWGQVAAIVITTLFVFVFKGENWRFIVYFWAALPLITFLLFLRSPFPESVPEEKRAKAKSLIFHPFYIFAMLAILLGAGTEVTMNQWASSFMEKGLELPKIAGDLLGMCGFAVMMGLGRTLYGVFGGKINMNNVMILGCAAALICYVTVALCPISWICVAACAVCGLAASLLWPGTIVIASDRFPTAGGWLFAILACAGDIGASIAPMITGGVVDSTMSSGIAEVFAGWLNISVEQGGMRIGLLAAAVFPLLCLVVHLILKKCKFADKREFAALGEKNRFVE